MKPPNQQTYRKAILLSIFYAYAQINIKYFDFWNDFRLLEADKVIKSQENWKILNKARSIYSNFVKQPHIFFPPKFLKLFFTPKNTPPKVKNSKMGLNHIFLGHPVSLFALVAINKAIIEQKMYILGKLKLVVLSLLQNFFRQFFG